MFTTRTCPFCQKSMDVEDDFLGAEMECPHCGKTFVPKAPAAKADGEAPAAPAMQLQPDAPNLSGAKRCPSCKASIAKDAVLCVHCGYHFGTGKRVGAGPGMSSQLRMLLVVGGILVAGALAWLLWPAAEEPLPEFKPTPKPASVQKAEPPPPSPTNAAVATNIVPTNAVTTNAVVAETPAPPAPLPPTKEELAQREAEAQQALFAAQKARAEQILRSRMEEKEPMFVVGDFVEMRRKNGVLIKGPLKRFGRRDDVRFVVITTELQGDVEIPIPELDTATRCRVDAEFREAYLQHVLSLRAAQAQAAATNAAGKNKK